MLDFDAVTKRFGSVTALDECAFTARPGRLTGFLGSNGAGKTTAGFFDPSTVLAAAIDWHQEEVHCYSSQKDEEHERRWAAFGAESS